MTITAPSDADSGTGAHLRFDVKSTIGESKVLTSVKPLSHPCARVLMTRIYTHNQAPEQLQNWHQVSTAGRTSHHTK